MKTIDEAKLESDLEYRYEYLAEFIGFGSEDIALIHAAAGQLAPLIPSLVERTYEKLLGNAATARHFVPKQHGLSGLAPESVQQLSQDHAQIRFRKDHLIRYFMNLFGRAYDGKMLAYLDMAGKIHTTRAGNKEIEVPLIQMNALMGLLSSSLFAVIEELAMDFSVKWKTLNAIHKLLWIQNDLINRHYCQAAERS